MGKIGYVSRVLKGASFKKFFTVVNDAHERSGKSKVGCFFDILNCMAKYGAGYHDYVIFELYRYNHEQRNTFLTRFRSKKLIMLINDHDYAHIFDNKNEFNKVFKDFIGREFVDLAAASKEEIEEFFNTREEIFAKMKDLSCGIGCELLKTADFKDFDEFDKYIKEKGFATIEDVIKNHPDIEKLYPHAANTIRVITMLDGEGVPHIMLAVFKMGNGGRIVDNYGLHGPVDIETGEFLYPAHSGDTYADEFYTVHPYTNVPFIGYKVPLIKETIEFAKKAALVVPQMRYVGWDIAITPTGPAIIEGNNYCAHDFWQLPGQTPGGIGMVPKIQEVIPEFKC